jgi:ferredoxin-fold anticodon binding domain-containing protein
VQHIVEHLVGKEIVIDVDSPFVYVGVLESVTTASLILTNADVHDLRDSTTSREIYIRDARVHGIQPNREAVIVRQERVLSVSLLKDVIP